MRLSHTRNRLLAAVAASLVFAAPNVFAEDHETNEAWRLFVADHTQPERTQPSLQGEEGHD
jgi:hypothetical protein